MELLGIKKEIIWKNTAKNVNISIYWTYSKKNKKSRVVKPSKISKKRADYLKDNYWRKQQYNLPCIYWYEGGRRQNMKKEYKKPKISKKSSTKNVFSMGCSSGGSGRSHCLRA